MEIIRQAAVDWTSEDQSRVAPQFPQEWAPGGLSWSQKSQRGIPGVLGGRIAPGSVPVPQRSMARAAGNPS